MAMSSLISATADWFKRRNTSIEAWYSDDGGRYAFRVSVDGQPFTVCAKKYLVDGTASFMASKVVQRAIDRDALLLLFVQEGGRRLVFDPNTVQAQGVASTPDDSPRARRGEHWLDIPTDHAVDFDAWADGHQQPPAPSDIVSDPDAQHDANTDGGRPENPGFITDWGDGE
jgi:hypothetical protein